MTHESRPEAAIGDLLGGGSESDPIADAAEEAVIGAMLAPPPLGVLRAAVARLAPEDFDEPQCRQLFDVIRQMAEAGVLPDLVTMPAFVRAHAIALPVLLDRHLASTLHALAQDAPVPASLDHYIDAIKSEAARRRLGDIGRRLARIAIDGDDEQVSQLLAASDGLVTR